jgi:hypothetical protein
MFYQTLLRESQKAVIEVLKHEIINYPEVFVEEDDHSYTSKLRHITHLELYKIEARPRIMPYNDMISWALEHIDIHTKSIINHDQVVVGSFRREHLQVKYKLSPTPKYTYNTTFLIEFERKYFIQYARSGHDIIKTWWGHL